MTSICSVSQKILSDILWHCFPKWLGILIQTLHACKALYYIVTRSYLCYKFLFNYLQLWSYAILSAITQFTSYAQNVHHRLICTLVFDVLTKSLTWRLNITVLPWEHIGVFVFIWCEQCNFILFYRQHFDLSVFIYRYFKLPLFFTDCSSSVNKCQKNRQTFVNVFFIENEKKNIY